jgi:hypothetical protein
MTLIGGPSIRWIADHRSCQVTRRAGREGVANTNCTRAFFESGRSAVTDNTGPRCSVDTPTLSLSSTVRNCDSAGTNNVSVVDVAFWIVTSRTTSHV